MPLYLYSLLWRFKRNDIVLFTGTYYIDLAVKNKKNTGLMHSFLLLQRFQSVKFDGIVKNNCPKLFLQPI